MDENQKRKLAEDRKNGRILAGETWHPLRIKFNFDRAETFISANSALTDLYSMSKRLLINVKKYFESTLKVYYSDTMTQSSSICNSISIPAVSGEPIDLYIVISAENNSETNYFAAASSCVRSTVDNRPIVGVYYLNFAGMNKGELQEYLYFSTFAHELTHILGFS